MKRDRYAAELERVTLQAATQWDLERMRDAITEVRRLVDARLFDLKRAEFKQNAGGN
jgi:hypothetical protein